MKQAIKNIALSILLATSMNCSQKIEPITKTHYKFSQEKHQTISGREITYNIIKLNHNNPYTPKIVTSQEALQLHKLIPDATIGINAAFFTPEKQNLGILKSQDSILNTSRIGSKNKGYLTHNENGFSIDTILDLENNDLVLESFPLLEHNNISRIKTKNGSHYRSAIALDDEKNLYLITTNSESMFTNKISFLEFKEFLESKNYTSVLNLDGGTSAQIKVDSSYYQKGRKIHAALGFYE